MMKKMTLAIFLLLTPELTTTAHVTRKRVSRETLNVLITRMGIVVGATQVTMATEKFVSKIVSC